MKQYKVYTNPLGDYEAVKQGWSWPGFFFSWIWAMVKKLWRISVGTIIALGILGVIIGASGADSDGEILINIMGIVASIIFGVNGNKWRENNLPTRGYEYKQTVTAANPEGAIALYIHEKKET